MRRSSVRLTKRGEYAIVAAVLVMLIGLTLLGSYLTGGH